MPAATPQPVTIVIPAFNQLEFCRQCIGAIQANTYHPYRLVLVDNGSTDGVSGFFDAVPGATVVHTGMNLGFSGGVNRGLAYATGHVVLLNSDTLTPPGWLVRLVRALDTGDEWGMIGPVTNWASGSQHIAGLELRSEAEIWAYAARRAEEYGDSLRTEQRLVGFCLLIRDGVYQAVGPFDERFAVGNFEDDDYSRRVRKAGWLLGVAEGCFVFHYGGRTFAGMGYEGARFQALMEENQRRYDDKWRVKLPEHIPPEVLAGRLNERARQALAEGNLEEAQRCLRAALYARPEEAQLYNDLGSVLWQSGQRDAAFAFFLEALRREPDHADARENVHDAAEVLGRVDELAAFLKDGMGFEA
ncbi:MAG: glycosyltransferase [Candidatus Hydrogenedentota bacterium]